MEVPLANEIAHKDNESPRGYDEMKYEEWKKGFTFPPHLCKDTEEYFNGVNNFVRKQVQEGAYILCGWNIHEEDEEVDDPVTTWHLFPALNTTAVRALVFNVVHTFSIRKGNSAAGVVILQNYIAANAPAVNVDHQYAFASGTQVHNAIGFLQSDPACAALVGLGEILTVKIENGLTIRVTV